jgi:hypothetical protein
VGFGRITECRQQGVCRPFLRNCLVALVLTLLLRQYVEITHDYAMAAARALSTIHPDSPFTFVHVSGEGATQSPGTFTTLYGRVKGQVETELLDLGKVKPMFRVYNVRPGAVDWTKHTAIHPFIPAQDMYKKVLMAPMNLAKEMGGVLTELAMSKGEPLEGTGMEGRLVPNTAVRRMAGL